MANSVITSLLTTPTHQQSMPTPTQHSSQSPGSTLTTLTPHLYHTTEYDTSAQYHQYTITTPTYQTNTIQTKHQNTTPHKNNVTPTLHQLSTSINSTHKQHNKILNTTQAQHNTKTSTM